MKKRILSLVLATLMIISVLPAYALADNEPLTPTDATAERTMTVSAASGAVHVNKSISNDGTELTLEAYLTNEVTQTVSAKPLDIVLVLDQSGSMAYNFNGNTTNKDTARRQYAMKQAVNTFISKVNEQYSEQGDHRMAIVTFTGSAQKLVDWTAVDNSHKATLTNAIDRLPPNPPEGATNVGAGMQMAQTLMNNAKSGTDRQKVVIVFTDGVPTTQSDFNTNVANTAIKAAKTMKDAGTVVYTVGIFNGANPAQLHGDKWNYEVWKDVACDGTVGSCWGGSWLSDLFGNNDFDAIDVPAGNRFLNYLSSNFSNAEMIGIKKGTYHPGHTSVSGGTGWKIEINAERTASNYYLKAASASELSAMFQKIVSEISKLDIVAGTDTILSDTLSQYFTLDVPANTEAKNAITVEKWDCTGKNASGYTWVRATTQPTTLNVEVTEEKTIKVTGFDYTQNAVTATTNGGSTTYSGSKLVVTIPIKPDTNCTDWQHGAHDYPTNDTGDNKAGLSNYKDKDGKDVGPTQLNQSPEAPVTAYSVTYTDGVENAEIFADQVSTVLPGTATPAFRDGTPTRENYEFNGWSPAVAETVTDNATYTATWTEKQVQKYKVTYQYPDTKPENATPPTDDTQYTVGQEYTLQTVTAPEGWTFNGWYKSYDSSTHTFSDEVSNSTENKMVEGGVTLYGKWTAPAEMFTVSYKFVSADGTVLPFEVTTKQPNSKQVAKDTTETPATFADVSVTGGTWKFNGWTPASQTITNDFEFIGTWEFKTTELPPEKTYDVSLTITKTVENVHGTAPDETYNFVVYYKDAAGNPVYLRDKDHPLTISLAAGEDSKEKDFTIKMTQTQLNNWPETLVTEGIYEGRVRFVYVEEIDGGTDHMTYAKAPVRGQFVGIAISSMRSVTKYFLYSEQNWQGIFSFTNVYNKTTGRDVTPAKVSPQLNRDDHVAYIMGYPDGKVRPEGEITRAEACTIFFRLLTKESRDYYFSRTNDYTDVSRTDWFNNAISTLSNAGIVTGYADGTFRPDQPITRGEMAKIIANFARLGGATKSFTDLSGHWAKSYVELAAGNGWIAGYPDGTFGPDKKITRAETVTMINRVLERVPAKESRLLSRSVMLTFPDNEPGEWYYIAVQEASNSHTYQRSAYETAGDEMWLRLIENVDWTKLEK